MSCLSSYPRGLRPPAEERCLGEKHTEKENGFAGVQHQEKASLSLLLTKKMLVQVSISITSLHCRNFLQFKQEKINQQITDTPTCASFHGAFFCCVNFFVTNWSLFLTPDVIHKFSSRGLKTKSWRTPQFFPFLLWRKMKTYYLRRRQSCHFYLTTKWCRKKFVTQNSFHAGCHHFLLFRAAVVLQRQYKWIGRWLET